MESKTFVVPNISCHHCAHTIKTEVAELKGVQSVAADVDSKRVTVSWDEPATWEEIETRLRDINYPPNPKIHLS